MPTIPLFMHNRLFWEHPEGHEISVPIFTSQTQNGSLRVPCPHLDWNQGSWKEMTPPGSPVQVKIFVPNSQHPNGDSIPFQYQVPVLQNPSTSPHYTLPCLHPMPLQREVSGLYINFYTDNAFIQQETIKAVAELLYLGVTISSPGRPLNIFHRPYLAQDPRKNDENPFWSHYDFDSNSIQILNDGQPAETLRDIIHHELGHATLGHRVVKIPSSRGSHSLKEAHSPALAMSEGWAHFVALAIRFRQDQVPLATSANKYKGEDWETRNTGVLLSPNIEYNVGCALWDCYDDNPILPPRGDDSARFSFAELYKVYQPSLMTLGDLPIIAHIDDFFERLLANNPTAGTAVINVRARNCGFAARVNFCHSMLYLAALGESLMVRSPVAGPAETFYMEKANTTPFAHGDEVHIKTRLGKYVVAENGGNSIVNANRDLPFEWETFTLERVAGNGLVQNNDPVCLKSLDGHYVRVSRTSHTQNIFNVNAQGTSRGSEETFIISLQ